MMVAFILVPVSVFITPRLGLLLVQFVHGVAGVNFKVREPVKETASGLTWIRIQGECQQQKRRHHTSAKAGMRFIRGFCDS